MASRISAINQLRPRIQSQGVSNIKTLAQRMSNRSPHNVNDVISIVTSFVEEAQLALERGETVKLDEFVLINASMGVGGDVTIKAKGDRTAVDRLNQRDLWTADKIINHENMTKSSDELVAQWDAKYPNDTVV